MDTKRHSLGLSFGTHRNGDAGLRLLAALLTVHPVAEGADARGKRGEGQIVVVPLSKQGHHVSELRVVDHAVVSGTEDVVGHLPHLRKEPGVNHEWVTAGGGSAVTGPTRGSRKLLMVLLLKPFGSEMPSSYAAGSQRVNGVLADPSRGFLLQPTNRNPGLETLLEKCVVGVHIACGARRPPFNSISSYRLLQMLVMLRYMLMLGRVKHCGRRTRAAHPVISDSFAKSFSESRSGTRECAIHLMEP